jgi:hypothetical protein
MIFVECKPDLLLVQKITGIPKKEILHSGNKGEVIKNLSRSKNSIGLIDEDPGDSQPKYIASMSLMKYDRYSDLKIYRDNKNNSLVVLCPVLEEWILKTARLGKIKMGDFNLPENASKFHKTINLNLRKFEMLLEILLTSKRITALKSVLWPKNQPVS